MRRHRAQAAKLDSLARDLDSGQHNDQEIKAQQPVCPREKLVEWVDVIGRQ